MLQMCVSVATGCALLVQCAIYRCGTSERMICLPPVPNRSFVFFFVCSTLCFYPSQVDGASKFAKEFWPGCLQEGGDDANYFRASLREVRSFRAQ